ncbi:MAG: Crp/Fnr family transcriptional regulator [Candidatus Solibacter sp.]
MQPSTHPGYQPREFEDALTYLPRKALNSYSRGDVIFDEHRPPEGLHLVLHGRVKVSVLLDDGVEALIDIFRTDDFLGESSLLGDFHGRQRAVALDNVSLMSWTATEIEEQSQRQPKLGIAFIQMFVQRSLEYQARLQSFALDKTPERFVRSLLRFAERMGTRGDDGYTSIPPLTHQVLAGYVGTTREIITLQMNHFRQKGMLRYSRKGIQVYEEALREYLRSRSGGVQFPPDLPRPADVSM